MEKKCFVIMPYGKNDSDFKAYGRIYKFLIKSAIEDLGLNCFRSDFDGRGGHILKNVIEDLAIADLVVADLSGLNWNVAYELGIRHVFQKRGTILICNSENKDDLPFDIQSLSIFFYPPDWMDNIEELCENFKKVVKNRLDKKTQCDSPVHDQYAYFPENILRGFSETTDNSLKSANIKIAQLEKELADVYKKIESMGLSLNGEENSSDTDYSQIFVSELAKNIYYSDTAVAKLRELLENEEKEEFAKFLGQVLSIGFLDETDCRTVYYLCRKLGIPAITRTYLEAVTKFYPENEDLTGYLANAYSQNYHTGEKAIQMVNAIIGVTKKDNNYSISKNTHITTSKLACFFNVYLHLHRYQDLLDISNLLCERFNENTKLLSIIYKNMTEAYLYLDNLKQASIYKEKLLEFSALNALTHYTCARYEDKMENYPGVINETEMCINLDNDDIDYYFIIAGYICDNLYARDPEDLKIKKIESQKADQCVLPFLLTALSIDPACVGRVIDFLRKNKFVSYIDSIVDAYQMHTKDYRFIFPELRLEAVNYCLSEEKQKEYFRNHLENNTTL